MIGTPTFDTGMPPGGVCFVINLLPIMEVQSPGTLITKIQGARSAQIIQGKIYLWIQFMSEQHII